MEIIFLIMGVIIALSALSGYFIGKKVYKNLEGTSNKNSKIYGVLAGVASFLIIGVVVLYLFIINIPFHR
jgi:hypothetical protein